jgi:alpha-tubulin suppressor-like RCC1 family protein
VVLKSDGTLVAWGANDHSQLGDGSTTDRARPTVGLTDVIAVSAEISTPSLSVRTARCGAGQQRQRGAR